MSRRSPAPLEGGGRGRGRVGGRKVVLGVAAVFLLLLGFVLALVFTIGLNNNGVKPPPSEPRSTSQ